MSDKTKKNTATTGGTFVPGLDELALRLQIPPLEGEIQGIALVGHSGRSYDLVKILSTVVEVSANALHYIALVAGRVAEVDKKLESYSKSGCPETTDNP